MARKQWAWDMAVSVRLRTSSRRLGAVGQGLRGGVDVAGAIGVGEEEVVAARAALDVDVLAELDGALVPTRNRRPSPQTGEPAGVSQSTRTKPVAWSEATVAWP